MKKVYTCKEDIKKRVIADYNKQSTMLNSLFFDFDVKLPKKDLLEVYAEIQATINGDRVIRLKDMHIGYCDNAYIFGMIDRLIPAGEYEDVYEGNLKDFLESFNGRELESGIYRVMEEYVAEDGSVHAYHLGFID